VENYGAANPAVHDMVNACLAEFSGASRHEFTCSQNERIDAYE
jgi:hypothetical protein